MAALTINGDEVASPEDEVPTSKCKHQKQAQASLGPKIVSYGLVVSVSYSLVVSVSYSVTCTRLVRAKIVWCQSHDPYANPSLDEKVSPNTWHKITPMFMVCINFSQAEMINA